MPEDVKVFRDKDEWASWNKRGDPVLHIDLMKWADVMVIAPASANSLAKLANVIATIIYKPVMHPIINLLYFSGFV